MTDDEIKREADVLAQEVSATLAGISQQDILKLALELFDSREAWSWEKAVALAWYRIAARRSIDCVIRSATRVVVSDAIRELVKGPIDPSGKK